MSSLVDVQKLRLACACAAVNVAELQAAISAKNPEGVSLAIDNLSRFANVVFEECEEEVGQVLSEPVSEDAPS